MTNRPAVRPQKPAPRARSRARRETNIYTVNANRGLRRQPPARLGTPAKEGLLVVADWRRGAEFQIRAGVQVNNVLRRFREDGEVAAFIDALVKGGLITGKEAKKGREAPTLTKFAAIGRHEKLLRRKEIFALLAPGYSTLYQLTVLYEQLPNGDEEQRVRQLVSIMKASSPKADSPKLTREHLIKETRRAKQAKRAAERAPGAQVPGQIPAVPTLADLIAAGRRFDSVVLTPSPNDVRLLGADFPDLDTLARDLPFLEIIEHGATVVIAAPITAFSVIVNTLLPLCGFGRPSKILLARRPASPDITDAEIIVIAQRGKTSVELREDAAWLDGEGAIDPLALAEGLCPNAESKLHVFAQERTEGWTCLIGDDSWIKETGK